jgi:hypothetical protein
MSLPPIYEIKKLSINLKENLLSETCFTHQCIQLHIIRELLLEYNISFEELTFEFLLEIYMNFKDANKPVKLEQL